MPLDCKMITPKQVNEYIHHRSQLPFVCVWREHLRFILLATVKYTIQCCEVLSACYTLDPQNVLRLDLEVCTL